MSAKKLVNLTRNLIKAHQPLLVPVYKTDGTLLAQKGIVLTDEQVAKLDEHEQLLTLGKELASLYGDNKGRLAKDDGGAVYQWRSPFDRLIEIRNELVAIYASPTLEGNAEHVRTLVSRINTVCSEAPDAALATIIIDEYEYYTAQHSVHVAVLCELTAAYLQWDDDSRRALVAAALTMNISVADFQDRAQSQATPLSDEQRKTIASHPEASVQILKQMGVDDHRWLDYVFKHHESVDGTGYPQGLMGEEVPLGASLLHLADVYCAKVSSARTYRKPQFPTVAARDIFLGKDRRAKGSTIEIVVKILGLYPPGCQVQLANGEVGVVIRRGNRVDAPVVRIIVDPKGNRVKTKVVRNTNTAPFAVKEIIQPNVVKRDPQYQSWWGY
ncbi:MAG: HD domain-containing protein [Gammaproteobacteria bacterium]|nr:HD domain-containing protein [Gammaproteobacteria bacterium]